MYNFRCREFSLVFRVYSFRCRKFGLVTCWFRVSSFGSRVSGFRFRVSGFGFRVSSFGFRVPGFGFRVSGVGFRVSGLGVSGLLSSTFAAHSAPSSFCASECDTCQTVQARFWRWLSGKNPKIVSSCSIFARKWVQPCDCIRASRLPWRGKRTQLSS